MRLICTLVIGIGLQAQTPYKTGWTQLSNTTISSVVAPSGYLGAVCPNSSSIICPSGSSVPFSDPVRKEAIVKTWNGAMYDPKGNQLLVIGGGHGDGFDNSVFAIKLNNTPSVARIAGPSTQLSTDPWPEAYPDGNPASRHTYDGLAMMGSTGYGVMVGGALYSSGQNQSGLWLLNTNVVPAVWQPLTKSGAFFPTGFNSAIFDSLVWDDVGNRFIWLWNSSLFSFTVNTSTLVATFTRLNNSGADNGYQPKCEIDPVMRTPIGGTRGRWMVCIGDGYSAPAPGSFYIHATDISGNDPTYSWQDWTPAANGTCDALHNVTGSQGPPGFTYDDALGMFVALQQIGGNKVYFYSTVTRTCSLRTFLGGPVSPAPNINGIFGRFRYVKNGNYFVVVVGSSINAYVLNIDSPTPGLGVSQAPYTCVDVDGDGYGTGAGCLGQDANDFDIAVHTAAQTVSAYGSIDAGYRRQGYYPTRYWTLDETNGNDSTGLSCLPADLTGSGTGSDCKPYKTWAALSSHVVAGQAVVMRGGNYTHPMTIGGGSISGTVYLLGFPGEKPTLLGEPNNIILTDQSYWVIDGIKVDLQGSTSYPCIMGGTFDTQPTSTFHDWIIRHVETTGCTNGIYFFNGLQNGLIEYNAIHDMTSSHGIYIGSRAMVSSNIGAARNLLYKNSRCGFQFNGRGSDIRVDQNILYQNGIGEGGDDICLENGVHDSFVRNNVLLDSAFGLTLNTYDGNEYGGSAPVGETTVCGVSGTDHCTCGASPNLHAICPFNEYNIVMSNNTFVQDGYNSSGGDISGNPLVQVGRQPSLCTTATCLATYFPNNTWQNTIMRSKGFATYSPPLTFTTGATSPESGPTNTVNGIVYQQTSGNTNVIGYGLQTPCCGYQGYTCAAAVSGGHIGSATSCTNSDPLFVASGAYNNIPGYDLRLQGTSPAKTGAVTLGALPFDITGRTVSIGSLGAYDYISNCGITTFSLPSATIGVPYSRFLSFAGCSPSTWAVVSGALPAWASLNATTGEISGTPSGSPGTASFVVSYDTATSGTLSIQTVAPCVISTTSFPDALLGYAYSQFAAQTGCSSGSWSVASGSLPVWASLNTATGEISGVATGQTGTATFTLSYSTATSGNLTITTVAPPPSITFFQGNLYILGVTTIR